MEKEKNNTVKITEEQKKEAIWSVEEEKKRRCMDALYESQGTFLAAQKNFYGDKI